MAGALRSSFDLAIECLHAKGYKTGDLGLAIGFDLGPISITRLGKHGDRIRCAIGRSVIESEIRQCACTGVETAIGQAAYDAASDAVQKLFGKSRKIAKLDYVEATEALADKGDESAKQARVEAYAGAPAIIRANDRQIRPHSQAAAD